MSISMFEIVFILVLQPPPWLNDEITEETIDVLTEKLADLSTKQQTEW